MDLHTLYEWQQKLPGRNYAKEHSFDEWADWWQQGCSPTTLNGIGSESLRTSAAKGFRTVTPYDWSVDSPEFDVGLVPTKLALIHGEVSEALEEFRKGHDLHAFMLELADIIIRVGQLGVGLGGDLDAAVAEKLEMNRQREHQHGGRLI